MDGSSISELSEGSLGVSTGFGLKSSRELELDGGGGVVELAVCVALVFEVCDEVDRDEVDDSIPPIVKDLMRTPMDVLSWLSSRLASPYFVQG